MFPRKKNRFPQIGGTGDLIDPENRPDPWIAGGLAIWATILAALGCSLALYALHLEPGRATTGWESPTARFLARAAETAPPLFYRTYWLGWICAAIGPLAIGALTGWIRGSSWGRPALLVVTGLASTMLMAALNRFYTTDRSILVGDALDPTDLDLVATLDWTYPLVLVALALPPAIAHILLWLSMIQKKKAGGQVPDPPA